VKSEAMRVIILAAGYGTRLYPLTHSLPKPLISINNKPIINFLIEKIDKLSKQFRIKEVRIVSNNKFYKDFLNWKRKYKMKVDIINNGSNTPADRLGATRDVKFAMGNKKGDWLVLGGDNLFQDNLSKFIEFANKKKPYPCVGLYDVRYKKAAMQFGVAKINRIKRVVDLEEKPKKPFSSLTATCIYFFPQRSLKFLDSFLCGEMNTDLLGKYIAWLAKQTKVFGYMLGGKWMDIGHYDSLKLAEEEFK